MPKRLPFDATDVEIWRREFTRRMPDIPTTNPTHAARIVSLRAGDSPTDAMLILRNAHGEDETISMNPFVAVQLISALVLSATKNGWIDEAGEIISQPPISAARR